MELAEPFSFTKGMRTLKIRCQGSGVGGTGEKAVSRLFDLEKDPGQLEEVQNEDAVRRMKKLIAQYMAETDAPAELYRRYGIEPLAT